MIAKLLRAPASTPVCRWGRWGVRPPPAASPSRTRTAAPHATAAPRTATAPGRRPSTGRSRSPPCARRSCVPLPQAGLRVAPLRRVEHRHLRLVGLRPLAVLPVPASRRTLGTHAPPRAAPPREDPPRTPGTPSAPCISRHPPNSGDDASSRRMPFFNHPKRTQRTETSHAPRRRPAAGGVDLLGLPGAGACRARPVSHATTRRRSASTPTARAAATARLPAGAPRRCRPANARTPCSRRAAAG